jgi:2-C-methyl-D-erythritol 4-phosphate cytidylyltransferase
MARTFVVVPAAGGGARFGGGVAKQYADLAGAPLLARTLDRLRTIECEAIMVALAPDDGDYERHIGMRSNVEAVRCGGATRAQTVRNALAHLAPRCSADDWIVVHDAARPCVPRDALARLMSELSSDTVGGLLAIPVADTLKRASDDAASPRVLRTEDRSGLWHAQTPQMFRFGVLMEAMQQSGLDATDEAQAVEALASVGRCAPPRLVRGSVANLKITYPEDLIVAAAILRAHENT